jgi:arylsulfatase A-like enzyme
VIALRGSLLTVIRFTTDRRTARGGISRREWLRLGAGGLGALALPQFAQSASNSGVSRGFGKARSVILIYASGGQSQLETWDPKPEAPEEVRGTFRAIGTSAPGVYFGEHMPRLAKSARLCTVVRSVSHEDLDHGSASYLALTGQYHTRKTSNPPPRPEDLPTYGSVLKRVRPSTTLPYTAVHLNAPALVPAIPAPGQNGGFLGYGFDPLEIGNVTESASPLRGLDPLSDVPEVRSSARRSLLASVEAARTRFAAEPAWLEMNSLYRQAYDLLDEPRTRLAFDLSQEPAAIRARYGLNRSGQACLLARRLVEAEVPLITVMWCHSNRGQDKAPDDIDEYGWDTHNDIFEALEKYLLPRFDQGFSALLEDLEERNLLDQTLVVCMGEFGRAPLVALEPRFAGSTPGRKHWAAAYSVVMAGAGVSRGTTYGATDRHAAYPKANPVGPWDVAATMYNALGVDPAGHYLDLTERPYPIAIGKPIEGLYG